MSKLTHSTDEGMDAIDRRRAIESGNEDLLPAMTAVSDETGRDAYLPFDAPLWQQYEHRIKWLMARIYHGDRAVLNFPPQRRRDRHIDKLEAVL